jgi:hypothetical protein
MAIQETEGVRLWRCPACGYTKLSSIEVYHVHSDGHNGFAYKMAEVE